MEIIRLQKEKEITNYSSAMAFYTKIVKTAHPVNIGLITIQQNGIVGRHEAPVPQLFVVVEGEGWVEGEDGQRLLMKRGEAVLWNKGENHTSGTETRLTAIVLESEELNQSIFE